MDGQIQTGFPGLESDSDSITISKSEGGQSSGRTYPAIAADEATDAARSRRAARLLDTVRDGHLILDADFRILYANVGAGRINNKPVDAFLGRTHWEEWPASVGTIVEETYRRVQRERVPEQFEYHYFVPGAYDIWLAINVYPDENEGGIQIVYRDVTDRRRLEEGAREGAERLRAQADVLPQIVWAAAADGSVDYYNRRWYEYSGLTLEETRDWGWQTVIHPEDVGRATAAWVAAIGAGTPCEVDYRLRRADGEWRWHLARSVPIRDSDGGSVIRWVGSATDIEEQKRAQEELREQSELLLRLVESSPDCIKTLSLDGRVMTLNEGGLDILQIDDFADICGLDWRTFWRDEVALKAVETALTTARAGGRGQFQGFGPTFKGEPRWWDVVVVPLLNADGEPEQLLAVSRDVTARYEAWKREQFLSEFTARVRGLPNPSDVLYETARSVTEYVGVQRFVYADIDEGAGTATVRRDFTRGDFPSMGGVYPLSVFDPYLVTGLRGGRVVMSTDLESDANLAPEYLDFLRASGVRSLLCVPILKDDRWVAGVTLHCAEPREWTGDETAFLTTVAEQTWLAVENARLESETRQHSEREHLLNEVGAAVRSLLDTDDILKSVVTTLGQSLPVDRCYFVRYNYTEDTALVAPEWHREGTAAFDQRVYRMNTGSIGYDPDFRAGRTYRVGDVASLPPESSAPLLELNARGVVHVPIMIGEDQLALGIMTAEPRDWTDEEVRLLENVATLTRSALEFAGAQKRERNIADQLQKALQPATPPEVTGLDLASFYRPALEEAGVGGDFFDVFALGDGRAVLVVADLSGKGLKAASQVALVRYQLRYALHTADFKEGHALARAVETLSGVLATYELLTGFATMIVAIWDAAACSLTYVNCGQEPGLVFRAASGTVEMLSATGPVLGGFIGGVFSEQVVTIGTGDILAFFTDGLTEVGPTRKEMLKVEGVRDIFYECCSDAPAPTAFPNTPPLRDPRAIADRLMEGVDRFGSGGVRDDVAFLIGVAEVGA